MKVFELMAELSKMPAGAEVVVNGLFSEEQVNKYATKYKHADNTSSVCINLNTEQCVFDDCTNEAVITAKF